MKSRVPCLNYFLVKYLSKVAVILAPFIGSGSLGARSKPFTNLLSTVVSYVYWQSFSNQFRIAHVNPSGIVFVVTTALPASSSGMQLTPQTTFQ